MKAIKNEWIEFSIYKDSSLKAKAKKDSKTNEVKVKLLFNAPRGDYYSFLNDAIEEASNLFLVH